MFIVGTPVFYVALFFLGLFLILKKFFKGVAFKVVGINFIVILFLITLFDSAAAMLFNHSDSFRIFDNFYHHGLKSDVAEKTSWKSDGISFYQIYTNSLGFVDETNREVPLKKSGKRVLFLGDSFMEGVGYPWNQTAAGIISERFKKRGVELLNAAVISYSPKLYYLKLKHFLEMGLEIDEVYVFIDISDIIDEVVYDYFVPKEFTYFEKKWQTVDNFFMKGSYMYRSTKINYFFAQINPYNEDASIWGGLSNFYNLKPLWTFDENAMKLYGEKGLASAKKYIDLIRQTCDAKGIKLHIGVWPWKVHALDKSGRMQYDIWKEYTDKYHIDFISLFDVFESMTPEEINSIFIANDIHWNDKGNKIAADYIWQHILENSEGKDETVQ
ncbi:hypothetical protein J6Z19_08225 [bacterium]|nr:hypothetical protein [bacterium]